MDTSTALSSPADRIPKPRSTSTSTISSGKSRSSRSSFGTDSTGTSVEGSSVFRRGISPHRLTRNEATAVDARSQLLRVHQQTKLISQPKYVPMVRPSSRVNVVHGQFVVIIHHEAGELSVSGYGSQVGIARESAAERMLELLRLVEEDTTQKTACLEPAPMCLSEAVQTQRATQLQHLRALDAMTSDVTDDDWVLFVDIEVFDGAKRDPLTGRKPSLLLEVGIYASRLNGMWLPNSDDTAEIRHFIVEEYKDLHNRHCLDNKFDFEPAFGCSELCRLSDVRAACRETVADIRRAAGAHGHKYLVGHSVLGDRRWMTEELHVNLEDFDVVDLADAYASWQGHDTRTSLGSLCASHGINVAAPHNAGNDVVYTAQLCKRMMRGIWG